MYRRRVFTEIRILVRSSCFHSMLSLTIKRPRATTLTVCLSVACRLGVVLLLIVFPSVFISMTSHHNLLNYWNDCTCHFDNCNALANCTLGDPPRRLSQAKSSRPLQTQYGLIGNLLFLTLSKFWSHLKWREQNSQTISECNWLILLFIAAHIYYFFMLNLFGPCGLNNKIYSVS